MTINLFGEAPDTLTCSRAGCTLSAKFNVNWRNPKIHSEDRVKVWLACGEHQDYLSEYLAARDFPVVVTPLGESVDRVPGPDGKQA